MLHTESGLEKVVVFTAPSALFSNRSNQAVPISSFSSMKPSPSLSTPSYQDSERSSIPRSINSSMAPSPLLSIPSA